jgi:hypothetical protein
VTAHVRAGTASSKAKTRVSSVPPVVESVVTEGAFGVDAFIDAFPVLVDAAGCIMRIPEALGQ